MDLNITNDTNTDLNDYLISFTIDPVKYVATGVILKDCNGIHFFDLNGNELPYWIEGSCEKPTRVWVKVPRLPARRPMPIRVVFGNWKWSGGSFSWNPSPIRWNTTPRRYGGVIEYNIVITCEPSLTRATLYTSDANVESVNANAIAIAAGDFHTCVLKANGKVYCYGDNRYGQAQDYLIGDAIGVSTGRFHTCVLRSNGEVYCYGNNDYGQTPWYRGGDANAVSAGRDHTCILKNNGNVVCYGNNLYGQARSYTKGDAVAVAAGGVPYLRADVREERALLREQHVRAGSGLQ